MDNFFQDLTTKVKETLSIGGGVSEVERNPNNSPMESPMELGFTDGATEVMWSQYRPGINIFARVLVHNHNKKENANLKFVKVVRAHSICSPGLVYQIRLKAKDGEKVNVYETTISLDPLEDWKEMINLGEVHLSHNQMLD